jgi:hypothetical protein
MYKINSINVWEQTSRLVQYDGGHTAVPKYQVSEVTLISFGPEGE